MFTDLWDDTFLVFWVGALLSNVCWLRAARHVPGRGLRTAFLIMALLAAALVIEAYAGQRWLGAPLRIAYPVLLTGARVCIAWWLWLHLPGTSSADARPAHATPRGRESPT